ncbi:hypothetical protein [Streptomyces sp. NRRL S-337]|uniref:hypothetical protein n=1 Tax=Streptomyces sp. NRRL S-337 TaxID=1463900 RepID=UPI0004C91ACC|nr:hypothetical protein [Streptomyces sp. NRRL S-337]
MTALAPDSRPLSTSGLETALAALPPVYAAAARRRTVPLSQGAFTVNGPFHEPVLLVRLRRPLADQAVVVRCAGDGERELPPVVYAPFSGAGTLLPAFLPPPPTAGEGPAEGSGNSLRITARVHVVPAPDCHAPVLPEQVLGPALAEDEAGALVEGVLLEGLLARLAYLATMEKQRIIRQVREISACRHVELAFSSALDSLGRDLGVRRLPDEDDARYRARLMMFTSWRLPTPAGLDEALNGPGADGAPNAGLPSRFGVSARFRLQERQNPLALATRLVDVGTEGAARRARFHSVLRTLYLLDLDQAVPPLMPAERHQQLEDVRQVLTSQVSRPAGPPTVRHLAPSLAIALARLVRLMRALGDTGTVTLRRAHVEEPDPLHELGLGATLDQFGKQRLTAMAEAVPHLQAGTGDMADLARTLVPRPFAEDPVGTWLVQPCGLRTVHPLSSSTFFVSCLPMSGLTIDGPPTMARGETAVVQARHNSDTSTGGLHVLAAEAVRLAKGRFAEEGLGAAPAPLTGDALDTLLQDVAGRQPTPPPAQVKPLVDGDLLAKDGAGFTKDVRAVVVIDQLVAYPFTAAQLTALGSGETLKNAVAARVEALLNSGFYSVQGIWDTTGNRLLVLASVSLLPGRPPKPGERPPAEFRWFTTEVPEPSAPNSLPLTLVNSTGGRINVNAARDGLALMVCLGQARRGLADPYEVRVELPEGAVLDGDQFGYVMNVLESLCPLGIEINTTELRRNHVQFGDDGVAQPFLARDASRTYHRYRRRRTVDTDQGPVTKPPSP